LAADAKPVDGHFQPSLHSRVKRTAAATLFSAKAINLS
jgi:hypothetical protein